MHVFGLSHASHVASFKIKRHGGNEPRRSRQACGDGQVGGALVSGYLGVGQKRREQWERQRRKSGLVSCGELKDRPSR